MPNLFETTQIGKHNGFVLSCDYCDFQAHKPDILRKHKRITHQGFRKQCNQCDKKATTNSNKKGHN